MDESKAERMLAQLSGHEIDGFRLSKVLGIGKSAAVFLGENSTGKAAIKIFDPDMISNSGIAIQEERITRQLQLTGHDCPTLIRVRGGGALSSVSPTMFYLVMDLVEGVSLREHIAVHKKLAEAEIRNIFKDIHLAAKYLLENRFCHRDIKPENIQITPDGRAILLDLGVLRPHGESNLTQLPHGRAFVGTLRYAPPEMLHGKETADSKGWEAITIYQLGGILHDMIMGEELFSGFGDPYADLVHAVDTIDPQIYRSDIGQDLVLTAKKCLLKNPSERRNLTPFAGLDKLYLDPQPLTLFKTNLAEQLAAAQGLYKSKIIPVVEEQKRKETRFRVITLEAIRAAGESLVIELDSLPKPTVFEHARFPGMNHSHMQFAHYPINLEAGFPQGLLLAVRITHDPGSIGIVQAEGVALRGATSNERTQAANHILSLGQNAQFESISNDLFSDMHYRQKIRVWHEAMLSKFFADTKDLLSQEIERTALNIQGKPIPPGSRRRYVTLFTTTTSKEIQLSS